MNATNKQPYTFGDSNPPFTEQDREDGYRSRIQNVLNEVLADMETRGSTDHHKFAQQLVEASQRAKQAGDASVRRKKPSFSHARAQLLNKLAPKADQPGGASKPLPRSERGA